MLLLRFIILSLLFLFLKFYFLYFFILYMWRPPVPHFPKIPKIWGYFHTSPLCVSPHPRPPVPESWWNIAFSKAENSGTDFVAVRYFFLAESCEYAAVIHFPIEINKISSLSRWVSPNWGSPWLLPKFLSFMG
jgi:hypothetical protein